MYISQIITREFKKFLLLFKNLDMDNHQVESKNIDDMSPVSAFVQKGFDEFLLQVKIINKFSAL